MTGTLMGRSSDVCSIIYDCFVIPALVVMIPLCWIYAEKKHSLIDDQAHVERALLAQELSMKTIFR